MGLTLTQPARAQGDNTPPVLTAEVTVEAAPIAVVTAEAPGSGDVTVTVNTPTATTETPATSSDPMFVLSLWQILAGLTGALAIGGIGGIAGAGVIATRLMNNPATMAAIEHAGNSVPPETASQILSFAGGFQSVVADFKGSLDAVVELTRKALDHVPEAEKFVAQPATGASNPLTPAADGPSVSATRTLTDPGGGNWPKQAGQ